MKGKTGFCSAAAWAIVVALAVVARWLFVALDLIVPKRRDLIVLGSSVSQPPSGNTKALFEHLRAHPCGLDAYFYYLHKDPTGRTDGDDHYIRGVSLRNAWILLRARTLVGTHGLGDFLPFGWSRRKLFVQTWHGVHLKAVVLAARGLAPRVVRRDLAAFRRFDCLTVPSAEAGRRIQRCTGIDDRKLLLVGQPRNDILLSADPPPPALKPSLASAPPFERAVLYAPTFRKNAEVRFFPFDDFDPTALHALLERYQAVLLLRRHAVDRSDTGRWTSDRILEYGSDVCLDVNDILREVDVVITDYSSIYMDFLLLDRPIVFVPYDLERYREVPGLMVDDYDYWAPGEKARTFGEFIDALRDAFEDPGHHSQTRRAVNDALNTCQDDNSSARIAAWIKHRVGLGGSDDT